MSKAHLASAVVFLCVSIVLAACGGSSYTTSGSSSSSRAHFNGAAVTYQLARANGRATQSLEVKSESDHQLKVDVTLAVGKGSYKIELLDKDGQVTLALEAADGQTVQGQGYMALDTFGEASYRVTAVNAEKVSYVLDYVVQ